MSKPISQREARQLRKRVAELERQEDSRRNAWVQQYPGGVHIASFSFDNDRTEIACIGTARRLGHAVVAIHDGVRHVSFYALPL